MFSDFFGYTSDRRVYRSVRPVIHCREMCYRVRILPV